MNASDWYREFRMRFNPKIDRSVKAMYIPRSISTPRWTELFRNFLESMARDLDFSVNLEESFFGNTRFDMKWDGEESGSNIFIEYENDHKGVERGELRKLANVAGDLRILITYIPAALFPGERLANKILTILEGKARRGFGSEFLLLLGEWYMKMATDWVAWRFYPTFQKEPLILPYLSNSAGVRASFARVKWGHKEHFT